NNTIISYTLINNQTNFLSVDENWTCSARSFDYYYSSNWSNTSVIIITEKEVGGSGGGTGNPGSITTPTVTSIPSAGLQSIIPTKEEFKKITSGVDPLFLFYLIMIGGLLLTVFTDRNIIKEVNTSVKKKFNKWLKEEKKKG
ncbi:MAG: hypothetical protein AABY22_37170, partial [Nanoarchaeota archaeon]